MHVIFFHAHGVCTVHTAYLALSDHSYQTNDANLILRIANGPDRNYPRWWQRMEMHAQHVHISVQLLASLLHFIIASVSDLAVSAVQIQMMDRLNKGWSLYTMYICTLCAWLNRAQVCGSVLVWNTCTTCIFLHRFHRSKYKQPIRQMDYCCSLKVLKGRLKYTPYFCTLYTYLIGSKNPIGAARALFKN